MATSPSTIPAASTFDELVLRATGILPYPYQVRLAEHGLPELLKVPTGTGKTLAATLPWLYRRFFHADDQVRAETPRWLVFVLPMRVLVEQTTNVIRGWIDNLELADSVGVHVVMGGEGKPDGKWRYQPGQESIFVGTLDMLLSRALNRGYGESRFAWPIDFGLFNSGCQWVFDEIQLMGPALPTSRQLEGLRRVLGTAMPCRSMWMSATVEERWLSSFDNPSVGTTVQLSSEDRSGPLFVRLGAVKRFSMLDLPEEPKDYARSLAESITDRHRPGTLTLAVMNTVQRAQDLYKNLGSSQPAVLLHSRFRPQDRERHVREALATVDPNGPGRIVVSTQVIEAGVDISATTMFTEAAPWPSVVQRAGRCNRDGEAEAAEFLWAKPPKAGPYDEADIQESVDALRKLEGQQVRSDDLGAMQVAVAEVVHPVLRRRDLLDLFDTLPDLSGNDLDVGRFIRANQDLDLQVAWRPVPESGPDPQDVPTRNELCPVPVGQLRDYLKKKHSAWLYDHLSEAWVKAQGEAVRPGQVVVLTASEGGYDQQIGWNPGSKSAVEPVEPDPPSEMVPSVEGTGVDAPTFTPGRWVSLRRHLEDVERAVSVILDELDPLGLSGEQRQAAICAGRFHDWGKAHPVFQATLERSARDARELLGAQETKPWAKSGGSGRPKHKRKHFRHELASALALVCGIDQLDGVAEVDLVLYLVGAHHGRVRLGIRSLAGETSLPAGVQRGALGVWEGDLLPSIDTHFGQLPEAKLSLSVMELGEGPEGSPSWTLRALTLRNRTDLGPFRLGFLEATLRLADWRASAEEEEG